jgi:hypothetical protein
MGIQSAEISWAGLRSTNPKFNVKRPDGKTDEEIAG